MPEQRTDPVLFLSLLTNVERKKKRYRISALYLVYLLIVIETALIFSH